MSEVLSVQKKEGKLRTKASFLGKISRKLPYGTQVTVLSEKGAWREVSVQNTQGWLHISTLTEKKKLSLNPETKKFQAVSAMMNLSWPARVSVKK